MEQWKPLPSLSFNELLFPTQLLAIFVILFVNNFVNNSGGLQFLLVWILFLVLWSIPVILIEYSVGRFTRKAPVKSFRVLLGPWSTWCGGWIVAVVVLIA